MCGWRCRCTCGDVEVDVWVETNGYMVSSRTGMRRGMGRDVCTGMCRSMGMGTGMCTDIYTDMVCA